MCEREKKGSKGWEAGKSCVAFVVLHMVCFGQKMVCIQEGYGRQYDWKDGLGLAMLMCFEGP